MSGAAPGGRFADFGAVHLVTTGALARLAQQAGRASVDASQFRPNLVLDAPQDPEPGQELRIGDVILRVVLHFAAGDRRPRAASSPGFPLHRLGRGTGSC